MVRRSKLLECYSNLIGLILRISKQTHSNIMHHEGTSVQAATAEYHYGTHRARFKRLKVSEIQCAIDLPYKCHMLTENVTA